MTSLRSLTNEEVVARFGDPVPYLDQTGHILPAWETHILTTISLPRRLPVSWDNHLTASHSKVHHLLAPELSAIFEELYWAPGVWDSINDYGGCYMWRPNTADRKQLSRHCWGIAVDLDVRDNKWNTAGNMDPRVIEIFNKHGWVWGGHFPTPDPMHFEVGTT